MVDLSYMVIMFDGLGCCYYLIDQRPRATFMTVWTKLVTKNNIKGIWIEATIKNSIRLKKWKDELSGIWSYHVKMSLKMVVQFSKKESHSPWKDLSKLQQKNWLKHERKLLVKMQTSLFRTTMTRDSKLSLSIVRRLDYSNGVFILDKEISSITHDQCPLDLS